MDNREPMYHSENTSYVFSHADDEYSSTRSNLEERLNEVVQETRLVIGLDYGTTYTGMLLRLSLLIVGGLIPSLGVAYATPSGSSCSLEKIDVMVEWGKPFSFP
jgi:hypothetical protein